MFDLTSKDLSILKEILSAYVKDADVKAFGSRVKGTYLKHSDLDLVIVGKEAFPPSVILDLKEALMASDISIRVDIVDWYRLSESFQNCIKEQWVDFLVA